VIESLRRVLGKSDVPQIDENTIPIRDFGLESEDGVDYACALSESVHYIIPHNVNPFVDDSGHRARNVGEIVDLVCGLLKDQEVKE
jgi:hypothetical protein